MDKYILSVIIFCISIASMALISLFKPTITYKYGKRVEYNVVGTSYKRVIVIETFFIFPLIGAILCIAAGCISFKVAMKGLWTFQGLNPIGIIILFFSMVYISKFLDCTGFFEWCALYAVNKSGGSGFKLYYIIYFTVSILTIFTSNDVVILTFTPFIYHFADAVGINPIPFLFAEFFAANTWSMIFIISNPTNIVLGTAFDISFIHFFIYMLPATLAGGLTNVFVLYILFRKEINMPFTKAGSPHDPSECIKNKYDMIVGLIILSITIILMAISSLPIFPFEMWQISGILGVVLLVYNICIDIIRKPSPGFFISILSTLPWPILPFLPSLFILVNCLTIHNVFSKIGNFLASISNSNTKIIFVYGICSTLAANILNNIPMSVSFVPIISSMSNPFNEHAVFASVIGSNLGANLTPLGALAGIMWLRILLDYKINLSFLTFVKIGCIITPFTLLLSCGILCLIHM